MNFYDLISEMWPCWLMGIIVIICVISSGKKELLRVDRTALKKWVIFLLWTITLRFIFCKLFLSPAVAKSLSKQSDFMPWMAPITVFWEDMMHGLPLLILKEYLQNAKWKTWLYRAILMIFMFEFGLGHLYQGVMASVILSMYVPWSINLGKKYGFGTVMLGHIIYDSFTLFFIRVLLKL